jgi:hypothetical protein
MGGLRPTPSSPKRVYNNSLAHILGAIDESTFWTGTNLAIPITLVDFHLYDLRSRCLCFFLETTSRRDSYMLYKLVKMSG